MKLYESHATRGLPNYVPFNFPPWIMSTWQPIKVICGCYSNPLSEFSLKDEDNQEKISQNNCICCPDCNPCPPEYEARALTNSSIK